MPICRGCFSFFRPFPVIPGWPLVQGRPGGMSGWLCLPTAIGIELILERGRQAWQGANDSKMQLQPWKTRLPCMPNGTSQDSADLTVQRSTEGSHLKSGASATRGRRSRAAINDIDSVRVHSSNVQPLQNSRSGWPFKGELPKDGHSWTFYRLRVEGR